ncbi:MAG: glucose-6-phosphate dehydrogenase, partial [Haliea sp.]
MSDKVDLVIFGGTGDLSTRKLLPALYQLHRHGLAERLQRIIATGRRDMDSETFRSEAHANLQEFVAPQDWDTAVWESYCHNLHYVRDDASDGGDYERLTGLLDADGAPIRLFYLATLPALYGTICSHLQQAGAVQAQSRVVLEKPLGHDLASCHEINLQVASVFSEE